MRSVYSRYLFIRKIWFECASHSSAQYCVYFRKLSHCVHDFIVSVCLYGCMYGIKSMQNNGQNLFSSKDVKVFFKQTKCAKKKKWRRWWWCSLRRRRWKRRRERRKECVVNFVGDADAVASAELCWWWGDNANVRDQMDRMSTFSFHCIFFPFFYATKATTTTKTRHTLRKSPISSDFFFDVSFVWKRNQKQKQKNHFHLIFLRNSNVVCNDTSSNRTHRKGMHQLE